MKLRIWWSDHRGTLLRLVIVVVIIATLVWLGYKFWRLVWCQEMIGASDMRQFYEWTHTWSAGDPVYDGTRSVTYPPASLVILWPLLGWLAVQPARWLWAATTVAALAWLISIILRESEASTSLERVFVALMPLSMYATGSAIGLGQLTVHVIPVLLAGLLLLRREPGRWHDDLLGSGLVLLAFVKPSIAVPFFWIVLFVPGRLRPALLVAGGYAALTLIAASFQTAGPVSLLRAWATGGIATAEWASVKFDNASVHSLMFALGLQKWNPAASLLLLGGLGIWVHRYRHVDVWLLLGVTAFVTRFWTYHGWYDDLLLLLPMVAMFRIAKRSPATDRAGVVAWVLLACTWLSVLAPGGRYLLPSPWNMVWVLGQVCVWLVVLAFLLDRAWSSRRLETATGASPGS